MKQNRTIKNLLENKRYEEEEKLTKIEKEQRNEKIRHEFITGLYEILTGLKMSEAEYILYFEEFNEHKGKQYNLCDWIESRGIKFLNPRNQRRVIPINEN